MLTINNSQDTLDSRDILEYMQQLDGEDDREELDVLKGLIDELREVGSDTPEDGLFLIRDSYFEEYAEGYADNIGAIDRSAGWPLNHIDWKGAAEELQMDYTSIDYDGVTYWVR